MKKVAYERPFLYLLNDSQLISQLLIGKEMCL